MIQPFLHKNDSTVVLFEEEKIVNIDTKSKVNNCFKNKITNKYFSLFCKFFTRNILNHFPCF